MEQEKDLADLTFELKHQSKRLAQRQNLVNNPSKCSLLSFSIRENS